MKLNIDSGKLLYVLGVLFATAALLYFVRDVVFDLSITVKAVLLFLGFVAFFVAGVALQRDVLDVVAFALSGVTYVVFVGYVVVRFSPGETGTFLLLAVSAALFVGLGYALREGLPTPSRRTAGFALGGILLVSALLVGVDAVTGGVTYDLQTNESITVEVPENYQNGNYVYVTRRLGSVTAENPSPFTRALDLPSIRGCLVGSATGPREDVWVDYQPSDREDLIGGSTTSTFHLQAEIPVDVNQTGPQTITIERGTRCDAERSEPTIALQIEDEARLD